MEAEPGPGTHALLPQAAHGPDVVLLGVQERFLAAVGFHGSFLRVRAPCTVGRAAGPRVLVRGRRLDVEAVEVLPGLRRRQREAGEVATGTVRESPQRR